MVRIRKAESRDSAAVFLLAHAFAASFDVEQEAFEKSFTEVIVHPEAYLAVAEVDGKLAGYILGFEHPTFFANGRVAWVEEIMVSEAVRRQGLGHELMKAFEA